jgi:MFS family permease
VVGRRGAFVIAGMTGAATLTAASAPSPLYPLYQRLWHFSTFTLTVVFAVYVFALLLALLTVGSVSDVIGRRPLASGALLLLAAGMLLFATAGDAGGLITARAVQGFAVGAASGTTTAMIIDSAPSARSGSFVSSAAPPMGIVIGAVLAGALIEFAPAPRQLIFWILCACYLLLAALVWLIPERQRSGSTTTSSVWRSLRPSVALPPATRPAFRALVPSICAIWALSGLYLSLGSSVLRTILGVQSNFTVGIVIGTFFATGTLGAVVSTSLSPQRGERFSRATLVLGILITTVGAWDHALPPYIIGSVIAGIGFGAAFRSAIDGLSEATPVDRRGEVFATMYVVSYLAFSVPALAAGLAADRFGLMPTAVAYGLSLVVLVLISAATRILRPRQHTNEGSMTHP